MSETVAKYVAIGLFLLLLVMLSGCQTTKEQSVIREVSDNGCRIGEFETSTGPRGRSAIIVRCK